MRREPPEGSLGTLAAEVRTARRGLDQEVGEARAVALAGQQAEADVARLEAEAALHERVAAVLGQVGEQRQSAAQAQVEALVSLGLKTVFSEDLSFHVAPGVRGKVPVVEFVVRTTLPGGKTVDTSVLDARGGGLAVVVSFLLRLVVLLLSRDRHENILFLDESFAHLSAGYTERLAGLLREVVDKAGVQIVMVSHQEVFEEVGDKVYRFELGKDGLTKVTAVK